MNVQHIKLNIIPGGVLPVVHVSQYDHNAGGLVFDIYNGGELYELPEGTTASIEGTKPDEYGFLYPAAAVSGHSVTIDVVEQMTVVPGKVICELRLSHQQDNVGTINFILAVEPAGLSDDTEVSETDIPLLREAIEAGQQALQSAEQAELSADKAEEEADRAEEAADNLTAIRTTVPAEVITVDDAKATALQQFKANIVPVQDLHGYERPWVGGAGKNLLPTTGTTTTNHGVTFTVNADGSVTITGETDTTSNNYFNACEVTLPAGSYILNGISGGGTATYRFRLTSGSWRGTIVVQAYDGDVAFTLAEETTVYLRIYVGVAAGEVNMTVYPMIRKATEADDSWMPYANICPISGTPGPVTITRTDGQETPNVSNTYTVTIPAEAGTVYGGTLTVNSDGSGQLVVDRVFMEFDGSTDEGWIVAPSTNHTFRHPALDPTPYYVDADTPITAMITNGPAHTRYSYTQLRANYPSVTYDSSRRLYLAIAADIETLEPALAWLAQNPVQICYQLQTPVAYAVTGAQVVQMLAGDNKIWTDAPGTNEITYITQSPLSDITEELDELQADVAEMQPVVADLQTNAVRKSDIVQTGTVTTAGQYAVDARQLNPTLTGTIAKRITDLETGAASAVTTADITRATNITATGTKVVDAYELNASKTGTLAKKISDAATAASAAQTTANTANTAAGNANTALGGFSFGYTSDNKPGFKAPGADTVVPFNSTSNLTTKDEIITYQVTTSVGDYTTTRTVQGEIVAAGIIGLSSSDGARNGNPTCTFSGNTMTYHSDYTYSATVTATVRIWYIPT